MNARTISHRDLLLPKEHGSWSLAFEPVALFLVVAPSVAGAALALAAGAGFFLRRPLKFSVHLAATDPRRGAARNWAGLFFVVAGLFLAAAAGLGGVQKLWPLLLAAPCGGLFLWFDLRHAMREAEAELAGSIAFALLPAAGATLAGWPIAAALALAALSLGRSVPTVLTVRTCLRMAKGQVPGIFPPVLAAGAAVVLALLLAQRGLVPGAAVALGVFFLLLTLWLVGPVRPHWPARRLGIIEAVLGAIQLAVLALAYHRP